MWLCVWGVVKSDGRGGKEVGNGGMCKGRLLESCCNR